MVEDGVAQQIVFFLPDFNGGGAERALLNILNNWPHSLRQKWEPLLVVRSDHGPLRQFAPSWLKIVSLNLSRAGTKSSLLTIWRLARILRKHKPALIVSFLSLPSVVFAARLGARKSKIAASVQNPPLATAEDKASASHLRSNMAMRVVKWAHRQLDLALPIAPGIADQLSEHYDVLRQRIIVVPNSVDLAAVKAGKKIPLVDAQRQNGLGPPIIVSAGRLVPQKRMDILLEAASILSGKLDFRLWILGDGYQKSLLEELAEQLNIAERVYFAGFQENPWQYFAQAQVFVLTSDYEGFGVVLIEAMACGLPVISTRAPYGPEYVIACPDQGILIPKGDPAAVAEALELVLTNSEKRAQLAAGGLKRAKDFSIESVFPQFWGALQTVLPA